MTREELEELTVVELKERAADAGVPGRSKLDKDGLIAALLAVENGVAPGEEPVAVEVEVGEDATETVTVVVNRDHLGGDREEVDPDWEPTPIEERDPDAEPETPPMITVQSDPEEELQRIAASHLLAARENAQAEAALAELDSAPRVTE